MSKKDELRKEQEEYWREEVEQLKADFTHSSSELGTEVLNIIERFVQKQLYRNRTELFQSYSKLMNAIVRAKPLMALFYTYSHRIFDFIEALPKDDRDILMMKKIVAGRDTEHSHRKCRSTKALKQIFRAIDYGSISAVNPFVQQGGRGHVFRRPETQKTFPGSLYRKPASTRGHSTGHPSGKSRH